MVAFGFFKRARKYDYRSGYTKDRKKAMMNRVEEVCKENSIDLDINSGQIPMLTRNRKHFSVKAKNSFIFAALVLLILLYLLFYYFKIFD